MPVDPVQPSVRGSAIPVLPRTLVVATVVGVVAFIAGVQLGPSLIAVPPPTASSTPAATPAPGGAGVVSITVGDVSAPPGSRLTAILYEGVAGLVGGWPSGAELGAFAVVVDADPFTVTETLREGSPFADGPSSARPVAMVPAGTHTLALFVGNGLGPYTQSSWRGLAAVTCMVAITVTDARRTDVHLTGVLPSPGTKPASSTPPGGLIPFDACETAR